MRVFCGIDWSERHHDVALVDQDGQLVARRRITDDAAGFAVLLEMLADAGDQPDEPVPVAIETPRGLLVAALRATGRLAVPDQPDGRRPLPGSAQRRPLESPTTATPWSWPTSCAPTRPMHRPLPADSELAQAISVLARAQQDAVWHRNRIANELRSLLREFYPGFLAAFVNRTRRPSPHRWHAGSSPLAPTPTAGATLDIDEVTAVLHGVGRKRGITTDPPKQSPPHCDAPQLRHLPQVEQAFGRQAARPAPANWTRPAPRYADLTDATTEAFGSHPDHDIITSFPGLAKVSGARILAEIGDDRTRFTDARALKAYAGSAPITRASGRSRTVVPPTRQEPTPRRHRLRMGLRRP